MEPITHAQRIFDWVRRRVASGDLMPGTAVIESDIAREFGVSRTPIREALLRLEQEGILNRAAGRIIVAGFSYSKAADLYVARAALEGMCAYLATEVASSIELDTLEAAVASSQEHLSESELNEVALMNTKFHVQIQQMAASQFLSDSIKTIDLWTERYRHAAVTSFGRAEQALAEHLRIAAVMRTGNAPAAQEAMQVHIMGAGRAFLGAIRLFTGIDRETTASIALENFSQSLDGSGSSVD